MTVAGGPITNDKVERQIQDAAHVLLDLCIAQSIPPGETAFPVEFGLAQSLSMAVQAVFMADHLKVGAELAERMKGSAMAEPEMKARYFGLGVGVGHCIAACTTLPAQALALEGVSKGISSGMEMRAERYSRMRKGGKPDGR